jgi:hypothetical protein
VPAATSRVVVSDRVQRKMRSLPKPPSNVSRPLSAEHEVAIAVAGQQNQALIRLPPRPRNSHLPSDQRQPWPAIEQRNRASLGMSNSPFQWQLPKRRRELSACVRAAFIHAFART